MPDKLKKIGRSNQAKRQRTHDRNSSHSAHEEHEEEETKAGKAKAAKKNGESSVKPSDKVIPISFDLSGGPSCARA